METTTWYVLKQRLAWIKMHERGAPVTGVCRHYGISRKTFYKWWRRYQEGDRDFHALKDRSRRPHSHPRAVPRATVERVLALRRRTRYGPPRLAYYLAQEGIHLSVFGAYRVLQRANLVQKRRSRPRKKPQSYAMAIPGQRVQVDVKYLPPLRLRNRPEPFKQYLYNAIDDCTRLQVAWVSSELTPQASVRFLERLLAPSLSPSRRSRPTTVWSSPMSSSLTCRSPTPSRKASDSEASATSSSRWGCPSRTARACPCILDEVIDFMSPAGGIGRTALG